METVDLKPEKTRVTPDKAEWWQLRALLSERESADKDVRAATVVARMRNEEAQTFMSELAKKYGFDMTSDIGLDRSTLELVIMPRKGTPPTGGQS